MFRAAEDSSTICVVTVKVADGDGIVAVVMGLGWIHILVYLPRASGSGSAAFQQWMLEKYCGALAASAFVYPAAVIV